MRPELASAVATAVPPPQIAVPPFISPQLCHPLPKDTDLAVYADSHVFEQKFDGVRVIVCVQRGVAVQAWSKPRAAVGGGKLPPNAKSLAPHVREALLHLPDGVYDGEHLTPRVQDGEPWTGRKTDPSRSYVRLFDLLELFGERLLDAPFVDRRRLLEQAVRHVQPVGADPWAPNVVAATQLLPVSQETVAAVMDSGAEGLILKSKTSRYVPGYRTHEWAKVKREAHQVMTIVGFKETPVGGPFGSIVLRDDEGFETTVGTPWKQITGDVQAIVGRKFRIEFTRRTINRSYESPRGDHFVE